MEELVSIIMPAYNAEEYIQESIDSVLAQTHNNWELLIVDDCSSDRTRTIIKSEYFDKRIHYFCLEKNSGAAKARQKAIDLAKGKYIAFLDSDDLWDEKKLELQINFMEKNGYSFSATDYIRFDEDEEKEIVSYRKTKMNYKDLLKHCPGNSTIILNKENIGKIEIPDIKKRNDYVLWLNLIKKSDSIFFLNIPLTKYRVRTDSISSNKLTLIKYHWHIYYTIEKIGYFKSSYYCLYWSLKGLKRKFIKRGIK